MTLRGTSTAVWAKGIWREEGQGSRSAWSRWETFPEKGPGKVWEGQVCTQRALSAVVYPTLKCHPIQLVNVTCPW